MSERFESDEMFNPQIRMQIWQGLLDAERYVRYYNRLADKYRIRRYILRFGTLLFALVEAMLVPISANTGLSNMYVFLGAFAVGIVVVLLVIWDFVSDYGDVVAKLDWVHADASILYSQWHLLWLQIEAREIDEAEAMSRQQDLLARFDVIASRVHVSIDDDLNRQTQEEAFKVVEERYAHYTSA